MRRSFAALYAVLAVLTLTVPGFAAEPYPTKPVRLVVGFAAGGPTDIPARFIADRLGEMLGQRVIVENKAGAAGMIATRDVLAQPADGYTLLLCTHFESINLAVYKDPGFRLADIAPISLVSKYYYAIALSSAVPVSTLGEFLKYAKERPGQLNYGTLGPGSAQDILARQLEGVTGIKMTGVPFRSGPQVMPELLSGRVQVYMSPTLAVMPYYTNKQLKLLAVSSRERLKDAPEIPTLAEEGVDFVRFGWLGVCAKTGTPQPVIALLNKDINQIVAMPEYRKLIESGGSIPEGSTPAELQQVLRQTVDEISDTVRRYGLQRQ
jgi:tripartite-type tricarboxylate transporter receptor subunit TctC